MTTTNESNGSVNDEAICDCGARIYLSGHGGWWHYQTLREAMIHGLFDHPAKPAASSEKANEWCATCAPRRHRAEAWIHTPEAINGAGGHPFKAEETEGAKEVLGVGEYVRGGMLHPEHWTELRGVNEDELERRFEIAAAGISPMQRPFARMWFESGFIEGAGWARPQMTAEGRRDFNEHYARTEGKL